MTRKQLSSITAGFYPVMMAITFANLHGTKTAGTDVAAPAVEPTSPKLTELNAQLEGLLDAVDNAKRGTPEKKAAILAVFTHEKLIDAEKANIRKTEAENKKQEALNARLAFIQNYKAAVLAAAAKNAPQEAKDAELAAEDVLKNELSARYVSSTPAKVKGEGGATTGTKGATGADIKASIVEFMTAGQSATEAVKNTVAKGFSRGTTGAVRTQMVKDGEITADGKLA